MTTHQRNSIGLLAVFILLVVGIGGLIGYSTRPDAWFEALNKPSFQPPPSVFSPVWTTLYVLIGIAGWRVWSRPDLADLRPIWIAQMVLNFLWSPVFFRVKSPGMALIVILLMLAAIVLFVLRSWSRDRTTALLFLPYLAWVSFATILNFAIWTLN